MAVREIEDLINKALEDDPMNAEEIAALYEVPLFSREAAIIQAAGYRKSHEACKGLAEVHGQLGLNVGRCPVNCYFCAFAERNDVFEEESELTVEESVARCRQFEADGANGVFLMITAQYPFERFLEYAQEIRRSLKKETVMVANTGDLNEKQAKQLKETGFSGVYHAIRLGEGRDTKIPPERRWKTFRNVKEAGLKLGTCVEPVGNEHSVEELVEKTIITRDVKPCYSGSARRIPIPGTDMAKHGIVSEARMAHILAVVRLALGYDVPGNCTHEPNVIGAAAGANLFWAETGSNPRDTAEDTSKQRGMSVPDCREAFKEAEWTCLDGPSRFYGD